MKENYINIYNNLIELSRNKELYKNFTKQDTFGDRLIFFLFHFAFFLNTYKDKKNKDFLQDLHDYIFRQLELSIREIGYGDQTINKKMKEYINLFYGIIDKIHYWDDLSLKSKKSLLLTFLDSTQDITFLTNYFEKYRLNLLNNTLNLTLKGVIKL